MRRGPSTTPRLRECVPNEHDGRAGGRAATTELDPIAAAWTQVGRWRMFDAMATKSRVPERTATARSRLRDALLEETALTVAQLSRRVGLCEREIPEHLEHLAKSLRAEGMRLEVEPATCVACEYVFADRTRATKPSRCPECSSERIDPAAFRIVVAR